MTDFAIVAGKRDAPFAESIRAGLQSSKQRDISVSESLPQLSDAYVVLLWSAALEAAHAIDIQALIGLWSDGRLLVVRRDATPLPLGMRDLPSLPPDKSAADVCTALSKPDSSVRPSTLSPIAIVLAVLVVGIFVLGGAYYYLTAAQRAMQAELTARLETATKASADLKLAQTKQLEALKEVEARRVAEAAALKSGDAAKIKEAQEATRRAEAEAAEQAELVKQRETASVKAREAAKNVADAARQAATDKAKPPEKVEVAAVAAKAEVPKAAQPAQPAAQAPQPAPKEVPKALTRSQREAQRDAEAAAKAIGKPAEQVAAVSPSVAAPSGAAAPGAPTAPAAKAAVADSDAMYQQALAMEKDGKAADAVRIYRRAARAGNGKAAKRLGDIFDSGVPGVSRDYAESLQWYQTARDLESVETAARRELAGVPEIAAKSSPIPRAAEPEIVAAARPEPAPRPPAPAVPETTRPELSPVPSPAVSAPKSAPVAKSRAISEPKAAKAPPAQIAAEPAAPSSSPPAPVRDVLKPSAPVPPAATAVPPPTSTAESGTSFAVGIVIIAIALGTALWLRSRRKPALAGAQPRTSSRAAAQAPVDVATLFVSYSHKDKKRVEPIVSLMEEMGRRVWMDRTDITGQAGWAGQIVRAIRECRAVVLMASPNSFSSDQVVRELYLAMNHKKTIVPIEIEPAELPDELQYILAPFQHHRLSGSETREVLGRALAAV